MPKNKKRKKSPSPSPSESSGSDNDSGSTDPSDTESDTGSDSRRISGDKSDEESDGDAKDQFLPEVFQDKPPKVKVSSWCKRKLHSPFLGTLLGGLERSQLRDDYFCSTEDYKLFSASRVSGSPLALMTTPYSSALKDLTNIHEDLLWALRVGLISYEKVLSLAAMFAKEKVNSVTNKNIHAGDWSDLNYRYRSNLPVPIPWKLREKVDDSEVDNFLTRDFMEQAEGERSAKLNVAIKYGLSYKHAFEQLAVTAGQIHDDALRLNDALGEVNTEASALAKDTGSSMRILGSVCQMVMKMREREYNKPLDSNFKRFLAQENAKRTPAEAAEARAGPLVDEGLASKAKKYGKLRKVMEQVTREAKQKQEKYRKAKASKKGAGTSGGEPGAGPSSYKGKGKGKGKNKGGYKGKSSKKIAPKKAKKKKEDKDE